MVIAVVGTFRRGQPSDGQPSDGQPPGAQASTGRACRPDRATSRVDMSPKPRT